MPYRYGGREDTELVLVLDCSELGVELLLQRVPEAKTRKNRMHLDLRTADLELEVRRLLGLGARCVTDRPIEEEGWRWHVLQDPGGNELRVLEPPPRRDA